MVKEKLSRGPIKHTACTTVATYFNTSVSTWGCCTSWWKESMYDKSVHTNTSTFASTVPGIGATSSCNPKRNFFFNFEMRPSASRLGWNSANHSLLFLTWWNKPKTNRFSASLHWSLSSYKKSSVSSYIIYKIRKTLSFNFWFYFFFALIWTHIWSKEHKKEIDNEKKDGCKTVWFVLD